MHYNRHYIDSMRIIILFGFLFLTACSSLQAQQESHHSLFAKSVDIMADSMRENIYELQKLDEETEINERAVNFVYGQDLQGLPPEKEYYSYNLNWRLKAAHDLQIVVSALVFDVPLSKHELTRIVQAIYTHYKKEEIVLIQRKAHAILPEFIEAMVNDWQTDEMQERAEVIVDDVNASEQQLLRKIRVLKIECSKAEDPKNVNKSELQRSLKAFLETKDFKNVNASELQRSLKAFLEAEDLKNVNTSELQRSFKAFLEAKDPKNINTSELQRSLKAFLKEKCPKASVNDDKNFILELEHATRQHLQKQKQREELLTNWENLISLTEIMQKAYKALLQKEKAPIQVFYQAALKLQNK